MQLVLRWRPFRGAQNGDMGGEPAQFRIFAGLGWQRLQQIIGLRLAALQHQHLGEIERDTRVLWVGERGLRGNAHGAGGIAARVGRERPLCSRVVEGSVRCLRMNSRTVSSDSAPCRVSTTLP